MLLVLLIHAIDATEISETGILVAALIGFGLVFFAVGLANIFADYLSLLETRLLIRSKINIVSLVLLDLVLTLGITISTYFWIIIVLVHYTYWSELSSSMEYIDFIYETKAFIQAWTIDLDTQLRTLVEIASATAGPVAYSATEEELMSNVAAAKSALVSPIIISAFTTSVWLWVHGLSEASIRALSDNARLMNALRLDPQNKPIGAMTFMLTLWPPALVLLIVGLWSFFTVLIPAIL